MATEAETRELLDRANDEVKRRLRLAIADQVIRALDGYLSTADGRRQFGADRCVLVGQGKITVRTEDGYVINVTVEAEP